MCVRIILLTRLSTILLLLRCHSGPRRYEHLALLQPDGDNSSGAPEHGLGSECMMPTSWVWSAKLPSLTPTTTAPKSHRVLVNAATTTNATTAPIVDAATMDHHNAKQDDDGTGSEVGSVRQLKDLMNADQKLICHEFNLFETLRNELLQLTEIDITLSEKQEEE